MNDMPTSLLFTYDHDIHSNNPYSVCQTMEGLTQALSFYGMQSVYNPEMFDPIEEFDGNPSRLSVRAGNASTFVPLAPTPLLEHDATDTPASSNEEDNAIVTPTLTAAELFPPLPSDTCEGGNNKRPRPSYEQGDDQEEEKQQQQQQVIRSTPHNKKRRLSNNNNNNKSKECSVCGAQFSRAYNKRTHELTHFKDRVKRFPCSSCPKSFDRKHDLQRHISALHTGKRTFACEFCPTTFSRRDALVKHVDNHH